MIELCLLGTGGMMPLVNRFLTSLFVKCNGYGLLIDCGEATQIAIKKAKLSTADIDYILITHFHADHISGISGLLLSMGNCDRVKPVIIVGPKGLEFVIRSLLVIAPELPFNIHFVECDAKSDFINFMPYRVQYFKLKHKIPCLGYNLFIDRLPEFKPEKAKENNVPIKYWNKLQHGETIKDEETGIKYTPSMVTGVSRKGIKISYLTDTRPCDNIYKLCNDSDLFICEGMYGDETKKDSVKAKMHMTMQEACEIATKTNPKEMWLTHYSPAENKPQIYEDDLKKIFKNVFIVKDGTKKTLYYDDEKLQ